MASITIIIVFHRPRFIINSNTIDFLMPKPHKTQDCIQTYYETDQMLQHMENRDYQKVYLGLRDNYFRVTSQGWFLRVTFHIKGSHTGSENSRFSANIGTRGGGGGKIKGDANQASHKLERGCRKIYFPDCDHKRERGGTPSLPSRPGVVTKPIRKDDFEWNINK